jgi:UDP-glucose 4-epimerase
MGARRPRYTPTRGERVKVLVTGGAGYIGSTICSALEDAGHVPVVLDSLVTGREEFTRGRHFYRADIADRSAMERVFAEHPDLKRVIHCAALIVVPESVADPYSYYRENVAKSMEFFAILRDHGQTDVVFSSSASVYGPTPTFEVTEESPLVPGSPYARTKMMMELVLADFARAYGMRGISLRYFNPIGADPNFRSGAFVENPSHVLGRILDVAQGNAPVFEITGTDWPTRDGTGLRDYIHVWDLAQAHVAAVERIDEIFSDPIVAPARHVVINLGTGRGVTVRELVTAFENVSGKRVAIKDAPRRPGDQPGAYANADRAQALLGWTAENSIEVGIQTALDWALVRRAVIK